MPVPTKNKRTPLAQAIHGLRAVSGTKQTELASMLGVSLTSVCRFERDDNGKNEPSIPALAILRDMAAKKRLPNLVEFFDSVIRAKSDAAMPAHVAQLQSVPVSDSERPTMTLAELTARLEYALTNNQIREYTIERRSDMPTVVTIAHGVHGRSIVRMSAPFPAMHIACEQFGCPDGDTDSHR